MAATAVQFTEADASFLVEALYHLTSPLTVRGKALCNYAPLLKGQADPQPRSMLVH